MPNKRIIIFCLACAAMIAALFLLCPPAYAVGELAQETMAVSLKELGLFMGTENGFELDKPCDRLMGAVILTRLLGWEQQAYSNYTRHPFTDIAGSYAEHHIGYLYQNGLVNGSTANTYGKDAMTAQQFATLILRALGYKDGQDFYWQNALSSLADLGILTDTEVRELEQSEFLRSGALLLCYRALIATPKNMTRPLIYNLLWNDAFTTRQLARSKDARLLLAADMPDYMDFAVKIDTEQQLRNIYWLSLRNCQHYLTIYAPGIDASRINSILNEILGSFFARDFYVESFTNTGDGHYEILTYISEYMSMQFYYEEPARYQKNCQFYEAAYRQPANGYISMYLWREKLNAILEQHISAEMSEYERLKALHDFLVRQTVYEDATNSLESSHFADGVLFEGKGACDGFSSALKMLLNAAGIESVVIYGHTPQARHAWNQVKIDGEWYNVDVTWANTRGKGDIYYGLFCAPDSVFTREHQTQNPALTHSCTSEKYYLGDSAFSAPSI